MPNLRSILHVDMDAFFASIEQLDHPEWRGKPVLVGSDRARGVVAAASYEARVFGCRSAQPMAVALRMCPDAIVAPVRGSRYHEVSLQVFEIFERFTQLVEPLSVDEAFLDVTGTEKLFGPPDQIARQIKESIHSETGLTASVGIAPNKFLAKLASEINKPDGLTILAPDQIDEFLLAMPVTQLWGVGPATARRLGAFAIRTVGDIRKKDLEWLVRTFGSHGDHLHRLAFGRDNRPVTPDSDAKSISQERTFETDLADPAEVRSVLLREVEQVARRLRRQEIRTLTAQVKIRYGDFETITRRTKLPAPSDSTRELWEAASHLFNVWAARSFRPVRLIGFGASDLTREARQKGLFPDPEIERSVTIDRATDVIISRFGEGAIRRAGGIRKPK